MRRLILVRHGESVLNSQGRFTGLIDTPLSEKGLEEAQALARALSTTADRFDAAYTSTLRRAVDTARTIIDSVGCERPCIQSRALDERDYGDLAGLTEEEAGERWGAAAVRNWRRGYVDAPPGGESLADTAHRALAFFRSTILPAVLKDRDVLVVSHGNTLRALIMALDGLSPEDVAKLEVKTAEGIEYRFGADAVVHTRSPITSGDRLASSSRPG